MPTAERYPTISSRSPIWDFVYSCLETEPETRLKTEELVCKVRLIKPGE